MVICIASGKGGTGKTTIATNLAVSLSGKVQLLDCDVEEPNAHLFMKPEFSHAERVTTPIPDVRDGSASPSPRSISGRILENCQSAHGFNVQITEGCDGSGIVFRYCNSIMRNFEFRAQISTEKWISGCKTRFF